MRTTTTLEHIDPTQWDHIIVPVSGGKDSQALLSLAVATPGVRDKLVANHQAVGFDHSLTTAHLDYMERVYDVDITVIGHAKFRNIFEFIRYEKYFPSTLARSCTSRLKIVPFANWLFDNDYHKRRTLVLLGMRGAESANRAAQYADLSPADMFSICDISKDYRKRIKSIQVALPIVDWTTNEVFDYIANTRRRVNPLYKRGHSRVGCYPCLLAGDREWALASRDPEGRRNIEALIDIEDEFKRNPSGRKLIRIHPERDVRALLAAKELDPFGFNDAPSPCNHCNQ